MKSRGFTLIEIVVVMVIVGVLLAMAAAATKGIQEATMRSKTSTAIQNADVALTNFVMVMRRLPCPANGGLHASDTGYGVETPAGGGACGTQTNGVLPWVTLGIPVADATDGYGGLLTYRAAPGLTSTGAMNLSMCDPAGTRGADGVTPDQTCAAGCTNGAAPNDVLTTCTSPTNVLISRGLIVKASPSVFLADPVTLTGAAYVVISHGLNRGAGFTPDGVAQGATGTVGSDEATNGSNGVAAAYFDEPINGTNSPAHFDDVLSRPTVMQVANRAALGPRAHN